MSVDEQEQKKTSREWCVLPLAAHETFECGVAAYAFGRHGTVKQLKGVVHEALYAAKHNINPLAVSEKGFARLNPNVRATDSDVLFGKAPGVQLKDTVSATGARDTALRASTYTEQVLGTPETVQAVAKHGAEIGSSGISTAQNEAIAARAGGTNGISWSAAGRNAMTGVSVGAAVGLAIALYKAYERYHRGEGSWQEFVDDALHNALVGGAVAGTSAVVGTIASGLLPSGNAAIIGSLIIAVIAAILISKVTDEEWAAFLAAITTSFGNRESFRVASR